MDSRIQKLIDVTTHRKILLYISYDIYINNHLFIFLHKSYIEEK